MNSRSMKGQQPVFQEAFDVVVVGSGFAGLAAAIEARLAGCTVLVIEKMRVPGGNSAISGGMIAVAASPLQAALGIVDTPEQLANDMFAAGKGLNDPRLLRVVTEGSAGALLWMQSYLGIQFNENLIHGGGHSVPRIYSISSGMGGSMGGGAAIIQAMLVKCRELGIVVRMRCTLKGLLQDESGRVIGVDVANFHCYPNSESGRREMLRAEKGVVLACGGFARDVGFRMTQDPRLTAEFESTNHPGATAEGLVVALKCGATPVHLSWIQLGPWTSADEKGWGVGALFSLLMGYSHGILVDATTGKRFINELTDRLSRTQHMAMAGRVPILIVGGEAAVEYPYLRQCLKRGVVKRYESIADLAENQAVSRETLERTIATYNDSVVSGTDAELGKPLNAQKRFLIGPPFFVVRLRPKLHYCNGGIQINEQSQVLNLETHQPIPSLYAAGEMAGGIHGACRISAMSTTECIVFGRLAGKGAAKEKLVGALVS
jgi:flavocytochrome c